MIVPPPWQLYGRGYVIFLSPWTRGRDQASRKPLDCDEPGNEPGSAVRPSRPQVKLLPSPAILMLLDYERSTVGEYREMLFIPGYVSFHRPPAVHRGHSISYIVVTTETSREGGVANWGIPKMSGNVVWEKSPAGVVVARISDEEMHPLLRAEISLSGRVFGLVPQRCSLPFASRFLPHTLIQSTGAAIYKTRVTAVGHAHLAGKTRLVSCSPDTEEIAERRVLLTVRVERFALSFSQAMRYPLGEEAESAQGRR